MLSITLSLVFMGKVFLTLVAEGFLAMFCLWPINDQPTSKGQVITFIILSLIFIGWMFNLYHINFSMN